MQIESKYLNYSVGAITFEAYCAYQPSRQKQPAVLVAPAWAGRGDFVCQKAKMLAEMGYVGIAIDVYGEGKVGHSKEQNSGSFPFLVSMEFNCHKGYNVDTLNQKSWKKCQILPYL